MQIRFESNGIVKIAAAEVKILRHYQLHGLRGTRCKLFGICGAWLMSLGVGEKLEHALFVHSEIVHVCCSMTRGKLSIRA